jgi:hypothetical protein
MSRLNIFPENIIATVERYPSEADWTLSEFFLKSGNKGVGVEDESRIEKGEKKIKGETRIQNGIYEFGLRVSPAFSKEYFRDDSGFLSKTKSDRFYNPHEMIWVMNVPLFEFILWHWGNTDDDTNGCYIVGSRFETFTGQRGVAESRIKYLEIYPVLWKAIKEAWRKGEKVYVEYKEKKTI